MTFNKTKAIGLLCGLGCALCVALYVTSVKADYENARADSLDQYGGNLTRAVVVMRDIAPGETLDESMLAEKSWVADLLPEGALTSLKDAIGQEVSAPLIAGEVVNSRRLGDSSTTLNVPAGFVAISIPVKVVQSVGGSIAAGQYVEVYATGSTSTSQLIKSALVLAVSAVSDAQSASSSAWVTLAVGPDSVLELVSAAQNLQLYLTLPGEEAAQASQNDEQREEELAHALGEDAASSTGNQTPAAGGQANSAEAQAAAVKNPTSITFSIKNKAHLVQQNGGNHE